MKQTLVFVPIILSNVVQMLLMKPELYVKNLILQPPSYVFAIVWNVIYLLFGYYLYNVFEQDEPFVTWIVFLWMCNLLLNMIWSPVVFRYKKYTVGVYMTVGMILTLLGMLVSTKDVVSKSVLLPYIAWLIVALVLNVELVRKYKKILVFEKN